MISVKYFELSAQINRDKIATEENSELEIKCEENVPGLDNHPFY